MATNKMKPLCTALGAAFLATAVVPQASADANPFALVALDAGYLLAAADKVDEGKCGEGKCGGSEKAADEGKCGEGKCGGSEKAADEGKCGEGKCGS